LDGVQGKKTGTPSATTREVEESKESQKEIPVVGTQEPTQDGVSKRATRQKGVGWGGRNTALGAKVNRTSLGPGKKRLQIRESKSDQLLCREKARMGQRKGTLRRDRLLTERKKTSRREEVSESVSALKWGKACTPSGG